MTNIKKRILEEYLFAGSTEMLRGVSSENSNVYTSDCDNCDALCCIAPDIVANDYKKPKNTVCDYLKTEEKKCGIYNERIKHGFSCCIQFECYGAGQAVTELFHKLNYRKPTTNTIKHLKNEIFLATLVTLHDKLKVTYKNKVIIDLEALNALRPFVNAAITLLKQKMR